MEQELRPTDVLWVQTTTAEQELRPLMESDGESLSDDDVVLHEIILQGDQRSSKSSSSGSSGPNGPTAAISGVVAMALLPVQDSLLSGVRELHASTAVLFINRSKNRLELKAAVK
eukprot:4687129-Amphidinium_carterae.1